MKIKPTSDHIVIIQEETKKKGAVIVNIAGQKIDKDAGGVVNRVFATGPGSFLPGTDTIAPLPCKPGDRVILWDSMLIASFTINDITYFVFPSPAIVCVLEEEDGDDE